MAKPRIFLSSTFYDLRYVRADMERFIKEMGYEPVLNERGSIPYGKETALEEYCYREIDLCDILIAIIGGRYGSGSEHAPYSISQMELKRAYEAQKQVYIFVENNVKSEYLTYLDNKGNKKIKFRYVDNIAVYKFLEEVDALPRNNPMTSFETSQDIINYLKAQWAGLFQGLLQEETRREEISVMKELRASAETLDSLVIYLTEERKDRDEAIKTILLSTHPAFKKIKSILDIPYRIFFTNLSELDALIKARQYKSVKEGNWDDKSHREWVKNVGNIQHLLKVAVTIFDKNGKLRIYTKEDWQNDYVQYKQYEVEKEQEQEGESPF